MDEFRKVGDGSFSLGSRTWPGLSKVIEECGEVLQVAGKLMGTAGKVEHWDGAGPLDVRIAEEMCDLFAACVAFFQLNGFDGVEAYVERERSKYETFLRWHANGLQEPEDKVTEPDIGIPKDLRDRLIEAWNFGQFADDLDVPLASSIRADIRQLCNVLERMPFAAPARRSSPATPEPCGACDGRGVVGGLLPNGSGYETHPCPDCTATKADVVGYVSRWGGSCRDCADENGVCPNTGLPCGGARKAIEHVIQALQYGVTHGYISNPISDAAMRGEVKL